MWFPGRARRHQQPALRGVWGSVPRARKAEGHSAQRHLPQNIGVSVSEGHRMENRPRCGFGRSACPWASPVGPAIMAAVSLVSSISDSSGREKLPPPPAHKSGPTAEDKRFLRKVARVTGRSVTPARSGVEEAQRRATSTEAGWDGQRRPMELTSRPFRSYAFVLCSQIWAPPSRCETLPRNLGRHRINKQRLRPSPRHPGGAVGLEGWTGAHAPLAQSPLGTAVPQCDWGSQGRARSLGMTLRSADQTHALASARVPCASREWL